jgi:predicted O-methyltransferase YrrM
MAEIKKFVRVIQRRLLSCDDTQGHLLPLLEPLFTIDTHMSFEERLTLFSISTKLPVGFVACEIGSYLGASTSFLAVAAVLQQGHVHAVDTWRNDGMPNEVIEDTWQRFQENVDRFRSWITPHRGLARELKDRVPPLDLLFVDGDHSYEETLANLSDFVPKLKPGAVLVMHDFNMESVQRAARDYFQDRQLEDLGLTHSLKSYKLL